MSSKTKIRVSTRAQRDIEKAADEFQLHQIDKAERHVDDDGSVWYDLGFHDLVGWDGKPGRPNGSGVMLQYHEGGPVPEAGQQMRMYGRFGEKVRGVDLQVGGEWVEWFYDTAEERKLEHEQWLHEYKLRQMRDYERERPELDRLYSELPPDLQRRIDRFRAADENFRWEGEAYEMAACAEAGRLYRRALDPAFGVTLKEHKILLRREEHAEMKSYDLKAEHGTLDWEDTPVNRLLAFDAINSEMNGYQYKLMHEIMPEMDDGHSGNTWGHAVYFARLLLEGKGSQL